MIRKKIDAMHDTYGVFDKVQCKTCPHLIIHENGDCSRHWFKCQMYGVSFGEGTDWRCSWEACGAFTIDPDEARIRGLYGEVYRQIKGLQPKPQREELPGQLMMDI